MKRKWSVFLSLLMAFCLVVSTGSYALAEEDSGEAETEAETEYIPEEYYDPIQTNEITGWPQGEAVQAGSAIVMDMDTMAVLYSKNADKKLYPASITKIMTTMIALEIGNLDDEITFSDVVYDIESDSTNLGIQPGEQLTLRQSLYGIMLESANDLANGVADYLAGSISAFADLMNAKAAELGCVNTHFTNPHGLHNEEHYTCAYDMALIARAAYQIPGFRTITSTTESSFPKTNVTDEERYFANHQKMIQKSSDYYQEWCTGGKTGYTSAAWNTLVTFGEKDGKRLVCVVMHENGAERAYIDTTALMNYGFEQFQQCKVDAKLQQESFYQAMKLNYLGMASELFQSADLKKNLVEVTKNAVVTIPKDASAEDLTTKVSTDASGSGKIQYLYQNWNVGYGEMKFTPLALQTTLPFEQKLDVEAITKKAQANAPKSEIEQTAMTVLNNTQNFVNNAYQKAVDYVENNRLLVILVGSLVLLCLIILMIILIFRCTRDSRIQRRRKQEEKDRLKMAEEIDRKTTAEIEAELRAAMDQEKMRQAQEEAAREEERKNEEKLKETENLLNELEKNKK